MSQFCDCTFDLILGDQAFGEIIERWQHDFQCSNQVLTFQGYTAAPS
jgi:hypothetical protein